MKLINSHEMYKHALAENYAVGAFNFVNLETLLAILNTAQENNSPVIIQCSTGALKYGTIAGLTSLVKGLEGYTIPVMLNLDHGKTFEECKRAIDYGFTNVMIDASSLPYEDNIKLTKQVVKYAHAHGVTVEAELGVLAGVEDEVSATDDDAKYTNPDQCADFIKRTGIDSLAIAIGTSHGTHKFKGDAKLRFDILEKIQAKVPNFPFVLHGASSIPQNLVKLAEKYGSKLNGANGIPEAMLNTACTKYNICKVNVDSDIRLAFTAGIREHLTNNPDNVDMRKYNENGIKYSKEIIADKINNVFCSSNHANY